MERCTQSILRFLEDNAGFDAEAPYTQKLAEKIARQPSAQHYANGLFRELEQQLAKEKATYLGRKRATKKRKSRPLRQRKFDSSMKTNQVQTELPQRQLRLRMPNVNAGKSFRQNIELPTGLAGKLQFCRIEGLDKIPGLRLDESKLSHNELALEGSVEIAGDFELNLYGFLLLASGASQKVHATLKVTIIPDPRSLWKDLPANASARYHKDDRASKSIDLDGTKLMAASVRGRSHAHKGTHREDDIELSYSANSQWRVMCVADGAGSCQYSRKGSQVAAKYSTQTLQKTLDSPQGQQLEQAFLLYEAQPNEQNLHTLQSSYQHTIVKAVYQAVREIQTLVRDNVGDTFKDYSSTLLLAAYKPLDDGHLVLSFWVGDGGAVIYHQDKTVTLLGEPDGGEYAGQTRFLDTAMFEDGSVYQRVQMQKVPEMTAIILATDGITDAKFDTEKQLSKVQCWDTLWSELAPFVNDPSLEQGEKGLLEWMNFWSQGNHDDRSIAMCVSSTPVGHEE